MKRTTTRTPTVSASMLCAIALLGWSAVLYGQVTTVRGKIAALKDQELIVATANGDVKAALTDRTVIRTEQRISLSDIVPGMYLGTTATKQADGHFLASEVHVFSEDQRGTGEGHRPLGSAPQSGATMTNANLERIEDVVVQNIKGRLMTLKFKGGGVQVLVPPDAPVVKRIVTDRSALKPGSEVSVQGTRNPDAALAASQITVRAVKR